MREHKTVVHYEIYQEVSTAIGSQLVKLLTMQCLDTDSAGVAAFESRLSPRMREYEKWGEIQVIRQTREEVKL